MEKWLELDGRSLTIDELVSVVRKEQKVKLSQISLSEMNRSHQYVKEIVNAGKPVYGINTGFGALATTQIKKEDLAQLQLNLVRSHCTGVGPAFSETVVRAVMLLRANCLAQGFSGVNPSIVELLLAFINNNIIPVVPSKGSVGASGDLAPLSHIALALIGEGEVVFEGKTVSSKFAIDQIGTTPAILGPKDGLALINGTAVLTALGALALYDIKNLMKVADITTCLTLDSVQGTDKAYHPAISFLKPHPGQIASCKNLNTLLKDSDIMQQHRECGKVQDPYSLRCVPQVHGGCRQAVLHAEQVITTEMNAVTDNPLIFVDTDEVISGGNFHGEAVALVMDYLAMATAEIANIAERRIEKMMNPTFSFLPAFLVKESGLNSGLMIAHVTAAALVSENKTLCHPASVDSVPTSTDKEDHVSMGPWAGRKLREVVHNVRDVLAIELLCNTQALEFQRPHTSSPALESVYKLIRNHVPPVTQDRAFHKDLEIIAQLIERDEVINVVESVVGELN